MMKKFEFIKGCMHTDQTFIKGLVKRDSGEVVVAGEVSLFIAGAIVL